MGIFPSDDDNEVVIESNGVFVNSPQQVNVDTSPTATGGGANGIFPGSGQQVNVEGPQTTTGSGGSALFPGDTTQVDIDETGVFDISGNFRRGPEGPQGPKGDDGQSVTRITQERNTSDDGTIIRFFDGATEIGQVNIPDGDDGRNGVAGRGISGFTQSPEMPAAGQESTLTVSFTDNTTRQFILPAGAQGIQGEVGERGPQGRAGADGRDGAQGPRGIQGPQGRQGEQGPIGPRGNPGSDGRDGMDGREGPQGPVGPSGPQGNAGTNGTGITNVSVTQDADNDEADVNITYEVSNLATTVPGRPEIVDFLVTGSSDPNVTGSPGTNEEFYIYLEGSSSSPSGAAPLVSSTNYRASFNSTTFITTYTPALPTSGPLPDFFTVSEQSGNSGNDSVRFYFRREEDANRLLSQHLGFSTFTFPEGAAQSARLSPNLGGTTIEGIYAGVTLTANSRAFGPDILHITAGTTTSNAGFLGPELSNNSFLDLVRGYYAIRVDTRDNTLDSDNLTLIPSGAITVNGSVLLDTSASPTTALSQVQIQVSDLNINERILLGDGLAGSTALVGDLFTKINSISSITDRFMVSMQTGDVGSLTNVPHVRLLSNDLVDHTTAVVFRSNGGNLTNSQFGTLVEGSAPVPTTSSAEVTVTFGTDVTPNIFNIVLGNQPDARSSAIAIANFLNNGSPDITAIRTEDQGSQFVRIETTINRDIRDLLVAVDTQGTAGDLVLGTPVVIQQGREDAVVINPNPITRVETFSIPYGRSVGSVSTVQAGTSTTPTIIQFRDTDGNALNNNVTIPQGPRGPQGSPGTGGNDGEDGRSVGSVRTVTQGTDTTPTVIEFLDTMGTVLGGTVSISPGPAGPQGREGPAGTDGTNGMDGQSVTNVTSARNTDNDATIVTFFAGSTSIGSVTVPDGEQGPTGASNTLTIGTVTPGDNASATITGTSPNQVLNLVLPRGMMGRSGTDGTQVVANPADGDGVQRGALHRIEIDGNIYDVSDETVAEQWHSSANYPQGSIVRFQGNLYWLNDPVDPNVDPTMSDSWVRVGGEAPPDTNTTYSFTSGSDGSFTVTPSDTGVPQVVMTGGSGSVNPGVDNRTPMEIIRSAINDSYTRRTTGFTNGLPNQFVYTLANGSVINAAFTFDDEGLPTEILYTDASGTFIRTTGGSMGNAVRHTFMFDDEGLPTVDEWVFFFQQLLNVVLTNNGTIVEFADAINETVLTDNGTIVEFANNVFITDNGTIVEFT